MEINDKKCDVCFNDVSDCICLESIVKKSEIRIFQIENKSLLIDFDQINFEVIQIKRNGRTLTFPLWEFWQILEKNE